MENKEWVVSHAKAREPIIVRGKTLKAALESEGLDPNLWKPITPGESEEKLLDKEPDE